MLAIVFIWWTYNIALLSSMLILLIWIAWHVMWIGLVLIQWFNAGCIREE